MKQSEAQMLLEMHLREIGFGDFVREYKFHPKRKWRFDYMIRPDLAIRPEEGFVGIEIEGGIHSRGRHVRGTGYEKDLEKYREATAMGYKVYRFSTQEVLNGTAREFIKKHCVT